MKLTVNERDYQVDAASETPLLYVLADDLRLKGPRFGAVSHSAGHARSYSTVGKSDRVSRRYQRSAMVQSRHWKDCRSSMESRKGWLSHPRCIRSSRPSLRSKLHTVATVTTAWPSKWRTAQQKSISPILKFGRPWTGIYAAAAPILES